MVKSQKHVFWQALIVALVIFNIGIFLGYMLESARVGKVNKMYVESELALLDVKIQSDLYDFESLNCEDAIQENVDFADKVFEEAKILDQFEKASRITDSIALQHKKYDLLRTLFWLNSIKLKDRCSADYNNVVYFYQYDDPTINKKAEQQVFSRLLGDLKAKYGDKVMLIPIAADNNISSVTILTKIYGVDTLPTILINEETKITELTTLEELEKYLN